ncbi:MAG: hypothetical protein NTW29_06785 [Bacteroidetes bacterium]|nr:hypothetical protein [Bacteroidota bacterium]
MKKVIGILVLAALFAACNNSGEKKDALSDSAAIDRMMDSASAEMNKMMDSASKSLNNLADSAKGAIENMADSATKKVEEAKPKM